MSSKSFGQLAKLSETCRVEGWVKCGIFSVFSFFGCFCFMKIRSGVLSPCTVAATVPGCNYDTRTKSLLRRQQQLSIAQVTILQPNKSVQSWHRSHNWPSLRLYLMPSKPKSEPSPKRSKLLAPSQRSKWTAFPAWAIAAPVLVSASDLSGTTEIAVPSWSGSIGKSKTARNRALIMESRVT